MKKYLRIAGLVTIFLMIQEQFVFAQDSSQTRTRLIALRDNFIDQIKAAGFKPSLPPPKIILDNPPSLGKYEDSSNLLHTGDWQTLPPEKQAFYVAAAKRAGNGFTGESYFEMGVHNWIFIHELAHWWRACQRQTAPPYENELAANRITVAYWRARDTSLMAAFVIRYTTFLTIIPNPVPAGKSKEQYFNDNYDNLPGASAYTWYQSRMIIDAYNETPAMTFTDAIKLSGHSASR